MRCASGLTWRRRTRDERQDISSRQPCRLFSVVRRPIMDDDVTVDATRRHQAAELWRMVQRYVEDERERRVLHLSYALGLRPAEICVRHPSEFADVMDVYRLKQRALG